MNRVFFCLAFSSALLGACAGSESYDETWGADEIPSGKADGLLDDAELLSFDELGSGFVGDEQLDVYAIELRGGDKITATMTVTSGDLSPHFTLYFGASSYVGSATFQRQPQKIIKTYDLTTSGRYYVGVKAYQHQGAGTYTFKIACTGGPCAGAPVISELTVAEQAACIGKARVCSFAGLARWNGAVGPARARSIFEGCLAATQTADGGACADACDEVDEAQPLCASIIEALPFYADASSACLAELDECLDTCHELDVSSSISDEMWSTAESLCWLTGLNGTCPGYARNHQQCGGTYAGGTRAECHAFCEATTGAWTDDLDTLCLEACD